jgi:two-component system, NarL family, captular synthesis response regulator RcsB
MNAAQPKITIALLDDHPAIIMAIKPLLNNGQFEVIGTYQTASALRLGLDDYQQRTGTAVQVALIDYQLGADEPDGTTLIKSLSRRYEATRFIVHSAMTEDVFKSLAIANGAQGFIGKTVPLERIPQHVLTVMRNRIVIDPPLQQHHPLQPEAPSDSHGIDRLTAREIDIARLLLGTMTNSEIATKLRKKPSTISTQARTIYTKLGVKDRLQFNAARDEWLERLDGARITFPQE